MITIDIERLVDAVIEENDNYFDYCYSYKYLHNVGFDDSTKCNERIKISRQYYERARDTTITIIEIFRLNKDQINRLYIVGRAVKRWRIRTNGEQLIPDSMQTQIYQFVFDN